MTIARRFTLGFIIATGMACALGAALPPAPVNPNANEQCHALLDYFYSLPQREDRRVLAGQFIQDHRTNDDTYETYVEELKTMTGRTPALLETQYLAFETARSRLIIRIRTAALFNIGKKVI